MTAPVPVSTYAAIATTPRLSGDGMDSEALSLPVVPKSNFSSSSRHRNLKVSAKAATIVKPLTPKHVPKEPFKGAIGPSEFGGNKFSTGRGVVSPGGKTSMRNTPLRPGKAPPPVKNTLKMYPSNQSQFITFSTSAKSTPQEKSRLNTPRQLSSQIMAKPIQTPNSYKEFSPSLTDNTLKFSQYISPPTLSDNKLMFQSSVPQLSSPRNDVIVDMSLRAPDQSIARHLKQDTLIDLNVTPPDDERQVEGTVSDDNSMIKNEMSTLKQQLDDLSKVNTDLKKLLVASVGDDLHWKMDALVRTKTQLATEIGGYTEKLMQDYEQLDKLSIQADMWRSKFMATRVLIDQLSQEKEDLNARWKQANTALQQMLQERQQLHDDMVETHRYLKFLRDSFDPVFSRKPAQMIPNILELARTNVLLSETIRETLLGGAPVVAAALDAGIQNGLSPAEKLAYQVLMSDLNTPSGHVPGRLSAQVVSKFGRFHPQVRYEGFTFTCCKKCKGEIKVL